MKKWSKKKKITILLLFLVLLALFAGLCWKKRRGIYNTYMKLTNQEIPYSVKEKRKKKYGYYGQKLNVTMDVDDTISIQENDDSANDIQTEIPQTKTLVATSYEIDQQLQAEQENGYTWDDPMVILNPYQISPLTAVVLFDTEEEYGVRFTVKGKTAAADISGEIDSTSSHRVTIIGLYPGEDNTVVLELLDDSGRVKDSQEITITTEALPESLTDVIEPVETSGESAYDLTMVYGQRTHLPFAYDCMGDIRWYMNKETGNYGLYMLSNCRMIWQDTAGEDQLWTISEVKDRAKHAPKAEEKPAEVKAEAAAPAEEKPVEEKAAPAVKKTTRKPAAKKTAAKTAAKSAGAKTEAAPAKAEEKPAEAAPVAKPVRKTATRKKTTKASK